MDFKDVFFYVLVEFIVMLIVRTRVTVRIIHS